MHIFVSELLKFLVIVAQEFEEMGIANKVVDE